MLISILLCFSLKVAEVSLSESGYLVPWWLTSHSKEVMAKVVNVTKDSDKDDLDILNQYSRIKKMWVDKDTDKDQIPF
jgi:hypothetical protein